MTKSKNRLAALAVWAVLVLASAALLTGGLYFKAGAAYDATPSEFGPAIETVLSGGEYYRNYKYGVEKLDEKGEKVVGTLAGYNVDAGEMYKERKLDVDVMLETVVKGGVNVQDTAMEKVYGTGWSQAAADNIEALFKAKYKEVYADGVPGIATGDVEVWGTDGAVIKQEYRYGESTANPDKGEGGNKNNSAIVYSRRLNKAFFLKNGYMHEYSAQDRARALGAPLTEAGTFTLSGGGYVSADSLPAASGFATALAENEYEAMIFEKGVIVKSGDKYVTYIGGVFEAGENAYRIMPFIRDQDLMAWKTGSAHAMNFIGDVDGQWHPILDVYTVMDTQSAPYVMYANFKGGCVKIAYERIEGEDSVDKGMPQLASAMRYAGYNFDKDYNLVKIPVSAVTDDDYLFGEVENPTAGEHKYVENEAVAYAKNYSETATAQTLMNAFRKAYVKYFNSGFVPGYRCSAIKMWDLCVLDFKYGDGTTGFDVVASGGRERMTTLVYNPVKEEAFAVYNSYFDIFKNDSGFGRKTLGYPVTDVLKDKEIGGQTFGEIQIFEKGYIFKSSNGNYVTRTGILYNEETNEFVPTPAPVVYTQYGSMVEEPVIQDGVYYMNYEKGAVTATLNSKGTHFFYDYFPGRNFNGKLKAELLPMELFITEDMLSYTGDLPLNDKGEDANFADVKKQLVAAYKKVYDTGYFPGFLEEEFKGGWNSVHAQQLVLGDSDSDIFGESRPGVSALVYNRGGVYFLTGSVITAWQSDNMYELYRAPTSDEFQLPGHPYVFQTFERGMAIRLGGVAFFTNEYRTPQHYIDSLPDYKVPTYGDGGHIAMK